MCDILITIPRVTAPRRLRIRFARNRDKDKVEEFYNTKQRLTYKPENLSEVLGASELPRLYIIEEVDHNRIVAAGACLAYCEGRFIELRSALVKWKGYGLHKVLTYVRTVQSLIMTNSDVELFCVVPSNRDELIKRMIALGFLPWPTPPQELLTEVDKPGIEGGLYMRFTPEKIDEHRRNLSDAIKDGCVTHIITGDRAELNFDILLSNDNRFRIALQAPL